MAMLADIICLIQGHLKSIDNRLANLEEALATPQTSMVDMMTLELDSDGLDFVAYQPHRSRSTPLYTQQLPPCSHSLC